MLCFEESERIMSTLSEGITNFFIKKNIVKKEEENIYKYGFELLLSAILSFIIMIVIGLIAGKIIESLIFYVCFILVRTYTGGYHAKTHLKCKIAFAGAQVVALLMTEILFRVSILYSIIDVAICLILVARFAPIENKNKKIDNPLKMKRISFVLIGTLYVVGFLANKVYPKSFVAVVSSIFVVAGLIAVDIVIKDKADHQIETETKA